VNEIVVLLGAEIDFQALYERQPTARRAEQLESEVLSAFRKLVQFPRSGSAFEIEYRRFLLKAFPYALFYELEGRRILIHAVLDIRQDPESIRRRLGF
jgi:plasmid stabilization system protein ParE